MQTSCDHDDHDHDDDDHDDDDNANDDDDDNNDDAHLKTIEDNNSKLEDILDSVHLDLK